MSEAPEQKPKKKRFRWGCFFLVNLLVGALAILAVLLFLPVPKDIEKTVNEPKRNNVFVTGGAKIEVTAQESLGVPEYTGPGSSSHMRLLVTAKVTNATGAERVLDLSLFQMKDGHKSVYAPHPRHTARWYEDEGKKSPWDEVIFPGQTKTVNVIFIVLEPPKARQLYVRRGFDWNNLQYTAVKMPSDTANRRYEAVTTTTLSDEVRDVSEVMQLKEKKDLRQ